MTTETIGASALAAVLLFWGVGAYNRLMRLRSEIVRRFAAVDVHWRERHALLLRLADALLPLLPSAQPRVDLLRTACAQGEAARQHACRSPGARGVIASLRLADEIVGEARARLPVPALPGSELPALTAQLGTVDSALAFARREFNQAVTAYNAAIAEQPTVWLARLVGFRAAGVL